MPATITLMIFAFRKLDLLSAKSGSDACPSCEMELAKSTEKGTTPAANSVTKSMCGPDSGMIPMRMANRIIHGMLELTQFSMWK